VPDKLWQHLSQEQVKHLDPPPGVRVPPDMSIEEVIGTMRRERTGCVLVVEDSRLIGVFTERDYVVRVLGQGLPASTAVAECMTAEPTAVKITETVTTLLRRIGRGRYRRMPIVDDGGNLIGCLSVRNLLHYLAQHCPAAVYNIPARSEPGAEPREGA